MSKGILLIALGHRNYVQMATMLAAGIKYNEPDCPIAIATDVPPPAELLEKKIVDIIVYVPESYYTAGGKKQFIKAKTRMYDLSPFDETIFLDVDLIWLQGRKPSELFEMFKDLDFTIPNMGPTQKFCLWADFAAVKAAYPSEHPMWDYHSEMVYFKKTEAVKKFFTMAKKAYDKPKIETTLFAGGMADELAFQIASMQTGLYPHQENFTPFAWYKRDPDARRLHGYQLSKKFFAVSLAGNHIHPHIKAIYNTLASFYCRKLGLQSFPATDKYRFLPERSNL